MDQTDLPGFELPKKLVAPFKFKVGAFQYKIVALRECPIPEKMFLADTPDRIVEYWRRAVVTHDYFNAEVENLVAIFLNTRRRVQGHQLISQGNKDTLLVHPGEVYRLAVMVNASAVILVHNHPSGDPTPSEADIKVTRDLIRAGQLLKIELLDHVVMGSAGRSSLRELGYFFT